MCVCVFILFALIASRCSAQYVTNGGLSLNWNYNLNSCFSFHFFFAMHGALYSTKGQTNVNIQVVIVLRWFFLTWINMYICIYVYMYISHHKQRFVTKHEIMSSIQIAKHTSDQVWTALYTAVELFKVT